MSRILNSTNLPVMIPYAAILIGIFGFQNAWVAVGLYYCGAAILISARLGIQSRALIGSGWSWKWVVLSIGFAIAILIGARILWNQIQRSDISLDEIFDRYGLGGSAGILFCAVALLINPIIEELFWRGCFQSNPRRLFSGDLIFAGYHIFVLWMVVRWYWVVLFFVGLALFGWMMRYLKYSLRGLGTVWFAHEMADLAIIMSILLILNRG